MLRTKLFIWFAVLVLLFGGLSAYVGIQIINDRVIEEAQTRVRLNLSSAWALYNFHLQEIETVLKLAAVKEVVVEMAEGGKWNDPEVCSRMEKIRTGFGLDFLDIVGSNGKVMMRTTQPNVTGDFKATEPAIASALKGEVMTCMSVISGEDMKREGENLAEKAYIELEDTPRARRTDRKEESRGMVMTCAAPIRKGMQVLGAVYGGVLVNRNNEMVDRIRDVVFRNEQYKGIPTGTATIFLNDSRIATTVRLSNGNRAIGTRASKEVADRVLDNGLPWIGDAYVLKDTYLSAYEPIKDGMGRIIGMLYVGILKQPFLDIGHSIIVRYVYLSIFVLLVSLVLAFIIAGRLAKPIHQLVEASNRMSNGEVHAPITARGSCRETDLLVSAFNDMTFTLAEREQKLKALNRSYMETLGFVSHELKSPVATIMNYVYLLREKKLGQLNEKQEKAVRAIDRGGTRLIEMVRHYLNLSRIENHEVQPVPTKVAVFDEVLKPIFDSAEAELAANNMTLINNVGTDIVLNVDINMIREVFENLLNNALKYGRQGGAIQVNSKFAGYFIEFSFRNDGEGIAEDKYDEIFQKFTRIASSETVKKQRGTGLGLFITKYIVEAHGGKIRVTSKPGEWAEFILTLPAWQESGSYNRVYPT
ncbi:MAG: hypothetical protein A2283_15505 [Lentisphaerae bacterium RIFOXYA12_FULL_48_11]|nr:MAG: hypothetical protein A2283_15505 [Lentisphaerae bacterium RIFOXYA12_FULL_48_11]